MIWPRRALPLLVLVLAGIAAAPAQPAPCNPDVNPNCGGGGGPTSTPITTHLVVDAPSAGSITSSPAGIGCPSDCSQTYGYTQTCDEGDCTNSGVDTVTLSASGGGSGYTPQFYRCNSNATGTTCTSETFCGNNTCDLTMDQNLRARVVWIDTTAPSKPTVSGPNRVGPSQRHLSASSTDNTGVTGYRYYLDGVDQGLSGTSGYDIPVSSLADGSTHTLAARARDAAGNESVLSDAHSFTVDRHVGLTASTPPGLTTTTPAIDFTTDADVPSGNRTCTTQKSGGAPAQTLSCPSPYAAEVNGDGDYTVSVQVTDDVGNTASGTRTFSLDTTAPALTINSPQDGDVKSQGFTPSITTDDLHGTTVQCKLDGAAYGSCGPQSGSPGPHTLWVKSTDDAGNVIERSAHFSFAGTSGGGGGGGQQGGSVGAGISDAALGDELMTDLKADAKKLAKQKQRRLAKKARYTLSAHALMAGRFTLSFKGAAGKAKASKNVTIAKGSKSATSAGTYKITLKLTKAGKKLLRKGKQVKGKLAFSFTKQSGGQVSRSKTVTLKRR